MEGKMKHKKIFGLFLSGLPFWLVVFSPFGGSDLPAQTGNDTRGHIRS